METNRKKQVKKKEFVCFSYTAPSKGNVFFRLYECNGHPHQPFIYKHPFADIPIYNYLYGVSDFS